MLILDRSASEGFHSLGESRIKGIHFAPRSRAFRDLGDLSDWVEDEGIDVLYLSSGFEEELAQVAAFYRDRELGAVSPVGEFVRSGLAMGIVLRDHKARLLGKLPAARSMGLDPGSDVLAQAEVIR